MEQWQKSNNGTVYGRYYFMIIVSANTHETGTKRMSDRYEEILSPKISSDRERAVFR